VADRSCDESVSRVYQYLDGEINWFRRVRIRYHLRNCESCSGSFSFEERLKLVVQENCREDTPPELMERLRSFMKENE